MSLVGIVSESYVSLEQVNKHHDFRVRVRVTLTLTPNLVGILHNS
jgi:hypothetical protein